MKMNKITQFLKKNVFYISMGIVIVGALVAVLFLPKEGNIQPDSNIKNEQAGGMITDEYESTPIIVDDQMPTDEYDTSEEESLTSDETTTTEKENQAQDEAQASDETTKDVAENMTNNETAEGVTEQTEEELNTQTFASTTATAEEAAAATFQLPVDGIEVVPYTDETTRPWFSQSYNSTTRTNGICLSAEEGTEVKAVSNGKVLDIILDSTTMEDDNITDVGNLGKIMVLQLDNGYKAIYGFQGGIPNESLKGKEVKAGDVLGTVGRPTGPFIVEGSNIYLQLRNEDKLVNPASYLELAQN